MAWLLLTATVKSGDAAIRIAGPVLPASTEPQRALDVFDELQATLSCEWQPRDGGVVQVTGRVHVSQTPDRPPSGPAACVYAAGAQDVSAARRRAVSALLAAQLQAAAQTPAD